MKDIGMMPGIEQTLAVPTAISYQNRPGVSQRGKAVPREVALTLDRTLVVQASKELHTLQNYSPKSFPNLIELQRILAGVLTGNPGPGEKTA